MPQRTAFTLSGGYGEYYATIFFRMDDGKVEKLEDTFATAPEAVEWLARKNFDYTGKILVITEHRPPDPADSQDYIDPGQPNQANPEKDRNLKDVARMDAAALDLAGFAISCGGDGLFQVRIDYMHPDDPCLGMYDGRNKFADVDEMLMFIKSVIVGVNMTKLKSVSDVTEVIDHKDLETV